MNRTGLFIALGVGLVTGLLFAFFPQLDLTLAHLFYDSSSRRFTFDPLGKAEYVRRAAMWIAWGFAVPAIVALIVKLIRPEKRLWMSGRAVIFLLSTILINAILLPDVVVKHHWGRARPIATTEFNGSQTFKPWWRAHNGDWHNTSFFSGEAATAFWTYAPAALAPPSLRPLAFTAATVFGLTTGILRMAFGAHYASDVLAAGVAAFFVTWLMHGFIYRWKRTRFTDEQIDRWLGDMSMKARSAKPFLCLSVAIGVLTLVRLIGLKISAVDLSPDEARYWAWAQMPALGYFSKPPLIAWIIAGVGRICGSSEMCLRAPAPLFYAATALICYFIARHLYDERAAFWTGLCIAFATGVVYSARIISTDVPLLFFWALAMLAYVKIIDRATWPWSFVLGVAVGLGLLAKYAMVYFLLGVAGATFLHPGARRVWRHQAIWIAAVVALSLVTPNLIWNATHDFITFRQTQNNIVGSGLKLDAVATLVFLGGQFGISGPILFGTFLFGLIRPIRSRFNAADKIMIAFALPPILLITIVSFLTSAQANWAATSSVSIVIFAVALLVRHSQWHWLKTSIWIGLFLQIMLIVGDAFADRVSFGFMSNPDVYHRTMGWKAMSLLVRQKATAEHVKSIAGNESDVVAELLYYLRGDAWPIFSWPMANAPTNQFVFDRPWTSAAPEPLLYLSEVSPPGDQANCYSKIDPLPPFDAPSGPHSARRFFLFKLSGRRLSIEAVKATSH